LPDPFAFAAFASGSQLAYLFGKVKQIRVRKWFSDSRTLKSPEWAKYGSPHHSVQGEAPYHAVRGREERK